MLSDEELDVLCFKTFEKKCASFVVTNRALKFDNYRAGFWEGIKAIRAATGESLPTDSDTIEVRLPVNVFLSGAYCCYHSSGSKEIYPFKDEGELHYITANLPRPKRTEPIEVRGKIE